MAVKTLEFSAGGEAARGVGGDLANRGSVLVITNLAGEVGFELIFISFAFIDSFRLLKVVVHEGRRREYSEMKGNNLINTWTCCNMDNRET